MEYKLYNVHPEAIAFGADNMVIVATYMRTATGPILHRNKFPATMLFHNVIPQINGPRVDLVDASTGEINSFLEDASSDGALWRHYNNSDKSKADRILLLVKGNNNDMYFANPSLYVEQRDGIAVLHNTTVINGVSWDKVQMNRDMSSRGVMWAVFPVANAKYGSMDYIACGNRYDFNRGSGRPSFCKITKRLDVAKTTDFKGSADLNTISADWVWGASEISDPDTEKLSFVYCYGVKLQLMPLIIPINEILK